LAGVKGRKVENPDTKFQLEYIKSLAENLKFCVEETGRVNRTIGLNGLNGILEAVERLERLTASDAP
jgi:hypothetical protein